MAKLRLNLDLDVLHLIKELEAMARSDREAVASFARLIILHLLLLRHAGLAEPNAHWQVELATYRVQLRRCVKGVLVPWLEGELDTIYGEAFEIARRKMTVAIPEIRASSLTLQRLIEADWLLP